MTKVLFKNPPCNSIISNINESSNYLTNAINKISSLNIPSSISSRYLVPNKRDELININKRIKEIQLWLEKSAKNFSSFQDEQENNIINLRSMNAKIRPNYVNWRD